MDTGGAQPEVIRQRKLSAPGRCNSVQSHTVKMRLLRRTIAFVGNLAGDFRRVRMSVFSQHNRKRINKAVNLRLNQLIFHRKKILLILLCVCLFNY